jgi:alkaline phosphatase D
VGAGFAIRIRALYIEAVARIAAHCLNRTSPTCRKTFGWRSIRAGTLRRDSTRRHQMRVVRHSTRRQFLKRSGASALLAGFGGIASPYLCRAADRPQFAGGLQSGDVCIDSAVVWARADRPARMSIEFSTMESFATVFRTLSADALPDSDFTAKLLVEGLPPGQNIFYRVRLDDIQQSALSGETLTRHFHTPPDQPRSISFAWSGDTAGQGWGIDPSRGGMRTYRTMLDNRPDFFIHSGDSIYADCPIEAELKLPNGELWRNIVTEDKSVVAHSLAVSRQL